MDKARRIVAMLLHRQRAARRNWRRFERLAVQGELPNPVMADLAREGFYEACNAAEIARRMLGACDGEGVQL
jgi:hypothetical protein